MNNSNLPQTITATDPGYYQQPKPQFWRYMVQLGSNEVEDDGTGHAVPVSDRLADVIVLSPSLDAIKTVLAPYLVNWQITSYWQPVAESEF